MKQTGIAAKAPKAESVARMVDIDKNISRFFTYLGKMMKPVKRVSDTSKAVISSLLIALTCLAIRAEAQDSAATANVVFYRYKQYEGSAATSTIFCDGISVVHLKNGRFYEIQLPAGEHVCFANDKRYGTVMNIEPGKNYYFRLSIEGGIMGHFRLDTATSAQAKYDISNLKPSGRHDVATTTTKP